jgi:exopolysaccharide production protein ExoZ
MIPNLQLLRAFAAINVVFYHIIGTEITYGYPPLQFLNTLEVLRDIGVHIFFVISGFVMLHTQMQAKKTTKQFYVSRLVRIVPIYWFVTSLIVVIYFVAPQVFNKTTATASLILSSYLFLSSTVMSHPPLVFVGWTLEWEMLFYLVFGISLFFSTWHRSILFVFVVLSAISTSLANPIVIEFFAGMLIAYALRAKPLSHTKGLILLIFGVFLLFASIDDAVTELSLNRIIISGIPAFFIVLGAVYSKQINSRLLTYLGDASYSIYLVQVLTIPAFYKLTKALSLDINSDLLSIFCLITSVVTGVLMYSLLEKPMTVFLQKRFVK